MPIFKWIIVAMMIGVGFIGAYYQFQMLGYSKPGRLSSVWRGGWIFHPEDLEDDGHTYRKRALACLGIFVLLAAMMKVLPADI